MLHLNCQINLNKDMQLIAGDMAFLALLADKRQTILCFESFPISLFITHWLPERIYQVYHLRHLMSESVFSHLNFYSNISAD